jgi:hypothetical protein
MAEPVHNRSTVAYIWVGIVITVVGGLILSGILELFHRSAAPAQTTPISNIQPTFINKIEPTFINKVQLPPPNAQEAPTTIKNQGRSTAPPVAQRDTQPSGTPAAPKTVADAPAPTPYFGYSTSDPNQITAISYSGFPMGVVQNRALDAYFHQTFNAVPRTDGQSHVSRFLVLNAERTDVSSEGCSLATQISISYYFKDPQGKRTTEDRTAKGRPACLSIGADQADREATASAMAAVARAID